MYLKYQKVFNAFSRIVARNTKPRHFFEYHFSLQMRVGERNEKQRSSPSLPIFQRWICIFCGIQQSLNPNAHVQSCNKLPETQCFFGTMEFKASWVRTRSIVVKCTKIQKRQSVNFLWWTASKWFMVFSLTNNQKQTGNRKKKQSYCGTVSGTDNWKTK